MGVKIHVRSLKYTFQKSVQIWRPWSLENSYLLKKNVTLEGRPEKCQKVSLGMALLETNILIQISRDLENLLQLKDN